MSVDDLPAKLTPWRGLRIGVVFCALMAMGIVMPDTQAFADGPEAPIVEECGGPLSSEHTRMCGTLNPDSRAKVGYYFAYNRGAGCTGGDRTPVQPEVEGEAIAVSADVSGLVPGSEYTYCLVATSSGSEAVGRGYTLQTEAAPSHESPPGEVAIEPAQATSSGVRLAGKLNPESSPTSYYFVYKLAEAAECEDLEGCGVRTGEGGPLIGDTQQELSSDIELTRLTPGKTYAYWLIAHNPGGTVRSSEMLFEVPEGASQPPPAPTSPAPEVLTTVPGGAPLTAPLVVTPWPVVKTITPHPLTRRQELDHALRLCKKKPKRARSACEKRATMKFKPVAASKSETKQT
jgi:hypothetical protein